MTAIGIDYGTTASKDLGSKMLLYFCKMSLFVRAEERYIHEIFKKRKVLL